MGYFKLGLCLASWFGVTGFFVFVPDLAWGQVETSQGKELVRSDSEAITIEGRLDRNSEKLDDNTYFNIHTFEGQAGELIVIELASEEFDSYLILLDPEDNKIAEDNDSGDNNNAKILVTLPATGVYEIVVNAYKPEKSGKYTLSLRAALPEEIELAEAERLNQQVFQLGEQGKYNEAIALAEKALAIRQRILSNEHPDVAVSLDNLAFLYHAQGRYSEAETLYLQSLEMLKHLLGEEHPGVATSLNALALLYKDQGKYEKAENYNLQALEMRKRLLGEEHPSVATSLNNLAVLYGAQGRYKEAEDYYLQAWEMRKRLLGEEHPEVATSLNNLADLYLNQGKYEKAEIYSLQALEMTKRLLGEEHPSVATSLNNLAVLYGAQGRYKEAETYSLQALEMLKHLLGEEHPHVALALNNLAGIYHTQGKYKEAEIYSLQALEMFKHLLGKEHPHVALTLYNLAGIYDAQGRYKEAEIYSLQTLEMFKHLLGKEHPHVALTLYNLAGIYDAQGRYKEAEIYSLQTLEMFKHLLGKEHPHVALTLNNLAILYKSQGRYEEAEDYFLQAWEMRKRLLGKEHPDVAQSLNNLAILYKSQGRYEEAEDYFLQAWEMRKRLLGKEHPDVAQSLNNLASLYHSQGRYSEAETYFLQALEMFKYLLGEEHPDVAQSLNNLTGLYHSQGRYSEAETFLLQSMETRKRFLGEKHPDVAQSLNSLAILYHTQGRYEEAEDYFLQAWEMRKRLLGKEHPSVADNLNSLGEFYKSQGRYEEAEDYFLQAWEMRKRLLGKEHPSVADNLNSLAVLYGVQGRYKEAETYYFQSLEMYKRLLGKEHPDVAQSLHNLAGLYLRQRRYKEAETYYFQALEMLKYLLGNEHPNVAMTLKNLAMLYWSQDKTSLAIEHLTQSIEIEEANLIYNLFAGFERQKRNYLERREIANTDDVNFSLHLNSAPNNPQAANLAFNTVLQRKGRVLNFFSNSLQILRQSLELQDQELLDELTTAYSQLANLIYNRPKELPLVKDQTQFTLQQENLFKKYQDQVTSLEERVKRLEREISNRSQEFRQEFQTPNIPSIQKLIPADATLLEFVKYRPANPKTRELGQPHYAAYILTLQGEPQGIDLGEAATIEQAVELFRYSLADADTPKEQLQETARQLDKLVMEPVRKRLGNSKQLLVSPQAALNLIPFEALVDEQGQYLVENYSFTYLTSGRDLLKFSEPQPNQQPSLVVVNPNFEVPGQLASLPSKTQTRSLDLDHIPFVSLPGTEAEGKAIAEKLGVTPLMKSQATEAAIKQVNSPQILHIATHGFFQTTEASNLDKQTYQDNPLLLSGLVLAGFRTEQSGSDEDGILTAQEVSALNLFNTKLVVFSACDTGLGELDSGEGLYSLRRALVIAGAESQVISLWKVEDNATKDLMVAYYDRILANQGRSEALRQTQLEMLKSEDYSHPHYWAAFIPSGNWRPIE